MRRCTKCGEEKPFTEFSKGSYDGYQTYCKSCMNAYMRERNLQRNFGMSTADYDRMHDEQGGLCLLCKRPERAPSRGGGIRRLAVDHNPRTGCVRGLLCYSCNTALGKLGDADGLEVALAHARRGD